MSLCMPLAQHQQHGTRINERVGHGFPCLETLGRSGPGLSPWVINAAAAGISEDHVLGPAARVSADTFACFRAGACRAATWRGDL
jgi:hypothetical protein